jgi:hypothetical protein
LGYKVHTAFNWGYLAGGDIEVGYWNGSGWASTVLGDGRGMNTLTCLR